jgi:hypothetical protein
MADLPKECEGSEGKMSVASEVPVGESAAGEHSLRAAVVAAGERWSSGQRDLVRLVYELDVSGEWADDGAVSCAHWVAAAVDVEVCTAREWLRIARALDVFGVIDAAFGDGRLSYSKVRALTRVATLENQLELCELAEKVPAGRLAPAVAAWLGRNETPEQTEARHHESRRFSSRLDVDGMVVGTFRLAPADAAEITRPIESLVLQRRPNAGGHASADSPISGSRVRWPSLAQQRADALLELVCEGGSDILTEIVMHVRADGCTLDDGSPIAGSVVERIAPQAFLRALIHNAEAYPINASGRQRHPSDRQRRVVKARDGACVDCGATEFLQYDHEPDFEQSRRTIVDELRLRCWRCHRARHRKARATH